MSTKKVQVICENCATFFFKEQKYITQAQRRGKHLHFCSRGCSASYSNKNRQVDNSNLPQNQKGYKQKRDSRWSWYYNTTKTRKKNDGLTIDDIKTLWDKQDGKCAYTGIKLYLHGECEDLRYLASLDRIDSSIGYKEGNVQFIAYPLNLAKNTFTDTQFREFLDAIRR